jgi:hypothetical protein
VNTFIKGIGIILPVMLGVAQLLEGICAVTKSPHASRDVKLSPCRIAAQPNKKVKHGAHGVHGEFQAIV